METHTYRDFQWCFQQFHVVWGELHNLRNSPEQCFLPGSLREISTSQWHCPRHTGGKGIFLQHNHTSVQLEFKIGGVSWRSSLKISAQGYISTQTHVFPPSWWKLLIFGGTVWDTPMTQSASTSFYTPPDCWKLLRGCPYGCTSAVFWNRRAKESNRSQFLLYLYA